MHLICLITLKHESAMAPHGKVLVLGEWVSS